MKTMLAALMTAAAMPAMAQEVAVPVSVGNDAAGAPFTFGDFAAAGEVDRYRVYLMQGRDYAFGVEPMNRGSSTWIVKGPTGTQLCVFSNSDNIDGGCGIRAGRTGYFTLSGTKVASPDDNYPSTYRLRVTADCRDRSNTRCRITPGQTKRPLLVSHQDVDWLRLRNLAAGRHYTLTISDYLEGGEITVVDSKGNALAGPAARSLTFRATSTAQWVRVTLMDELGPRGYDLSLR
jgi:hypothetical protein